MNDAQARAAVTPAPGSDFYYASHYLDAAARERARIIEALHRELARIPASCSDRGVAHVKLAWWREELSADGGASARHPLTRAAAPLLAEEPTLRAVFVRLVDAVDASLLEPRLADRAAVIAAISALHGEVWTALAGAQPHAEAIPPQRLCALTELAYALCDLRHHRAGGTLYLADDALARHRLHVEDIRTATSSDALRVLLREELGTVHEQLAACVAALPRALRRRQRLFTTLARIRLHALRLTLDDDCSVIERRVEPTPVHKLYLAWRSARLG